jgi:DNA-binding beta-propeller fold protein YncE
LTQNSEFNQPLSSENTSGWSRRQLLAASTSAALSCLGCRRKRATGFPGFALVTLAGENSLAFVDLNTFHFAHKIDLRSTPSSVSADADQAYVVTPANGSVSVIDADQQRIRNTIRLSDHLDLFRLTPVRGQMAGISAQGREAVVADAQSGKVTLRRRLNSAPVDADVKLHESKRRLFLATAGGTSGTVELIDLQSGAQQKRQLDGEIGAIRFRKDGQLLFVANYQGQTLIVLDTATLQTVCELPVPMRPENLSFSADQGQLFVSGTGADAISIVYVYDTLEVEQTILAGRAPGAMACSDSPRYLFVASRAGSDISILSIETRKMIALTQAGERPTRIEITPDQQYALVLNEASGDVAAIRIPAIRGNRLKNGASLFAMIPVGQNPTDLAILREQA